MRRVLSQAEHSIVTYKGNEIIRLRCRVQKLMDGRTVLLSLSPKIVKLFDEIERTVRLPCPTDDKPYSLDPVVVFPEEEDVFSAMDQNNLCSLLLKKECIVGTKIHLFEFRINNGRASRDALITVVEISANLDKKKENGLQNTKSISSTQIKFCSHVIGQNVIF